MFSLLKNHPRAVLWAAIVHIVFLVMMGVSFHFIDAPTVSSPETKVVKAVLKDDSIAQKKLKKKLEAEKRKKELIEKKRKKELQIKKEKKLAAELKKKNLAKIKADRKRIEEEHQRQLEAENKRIEEEKELRQREDKLKKELEEEQQRLAAEQEIRNETLISKQLGLIKSRIEQRWIKPSSTKVGMVCTIRVSLIPSGEVIDVQYLKRSGNVAFDRSVFAAVQRASPLPLPPIEYGLSDRFRKIELNFGQK